VFAPLESAVTTANESRKTTSVSWWMGKSFLLNESAALRKGENEVTHWWLQSRLFAFLGHSLGFVQTDEERKNMFIDMKQLPETVRLCKSTILNRVKDGTFPAPVRLSARRIAWLKSDVMAWIANLPKVEA
jgi:prophage regulatory protein